MTDRYRRMSDEEIENLLRDADRRMPSGALWERLAAEADRGAVRRVFPWRTAAAAVVMLAVLGLALLTSGRPVPPQLPARSPAVTTRAAVTPPPPAPQPSTQQASAAPAVAKAAKPRPVQQPPVTRQVRRESLAPTAEPQQVEKPADASAPIEDERVAIAPMPADTREEIPESSYYIQVSRGSSSSVLEGSVTHSSSGDPKEIRIAYDTNTPRMNGAN